MDNRLAELTIEPKLILPTRDVWKQLGVQTQLYARLIGAFGHSMSHPYFGNAMSVHFAALMLAGYDLDADTAECAVFAKSESQRLAMMRLGHAELVNITGMDCSYDLAQWREYLMEFSDECGHYKHPYAFDVVDTAIQRAISDPEFQRLARFLST